jgi:hypothetical protein
MLKKSALLKKIRIMSDILGDGIFAVDGDKWKQQRENRQPRLLDEGPPGL